MHKFDPYEYLGVIIPGVVVTITLILSYPAVGSLLSTGVTIGEFGLILIIAIVVGHLLQALGNAYEGVVWMCLGGMPTTWLSNKKQRLLSPKQAERMASAMIADFDAQISDLGSGKGLIREIYALVRTTGKTDRIDAFNRNYGLMRGIAAAMLVAAVIVLVRNLNHWPFVAILVGAAAIATYRMTRFGEHYAREIFVEYLNSRDRVAKLSKSEK